jgi:hypothetical protein
MDDRAKVPDDELDRFLAAALAESPLPDRDFTSSLSGRLRRYRQRRRLAVGVALSFGMVITVLGLYTSPAPFEAASLVSLQGIALALVLTALCSLVWIGTESHQFIAGGRSPDRIGTPAR